MQYKVQLSTLQVTLLSDHTVVPLRTAVMTASRTQQPHVMLGLSMSRTNNVGFTTLTLPILPVTPLLLPMVTMAVKPAWANVNTICEKNILKLSLVFQSMRHQFPTQG